MKRLFIPLLVALLMLGLFASVTAAPRPVRPIPTPSYCQRGSACVPISTTAPRVCNPPPGCDPRREACIAKCYP